MYRATCAAAGFGGSDQGDARSWSTASCTSPCPTTSGPSMRAPAAKSGTYTWHIEGRHSHRQPRRGRLRQLAVFRNARLQSGLAEPEGRQGALAQAHLRSRPVSISARSRPLIVKNHVITGVSGDDLDIPGYIESHDPGNRRAAMALVRVPRSRAIPRRRPGRAWRR